jgi:hypothetical protein
MVQNTFSKYSSIRQRIRIKVFRDEKIWPLFYGIKIMKLLWKSNYNKIELVNKAEAQVSVVKTN